MSIADKVSEAETEVLKVLWARNEALASTEINDALMNSMGWDKSTIRTLIRRLTEKGAVVQEKRELFYYRAAITEKEFLAAQTKNFLEKIYGGNAKNLVASLIEQEYIKSSDVDELKRFWEGGRSEV